VRRGSEVADSARGGGAVKRAEEEDFGGGRRSRWRKKEVEAWRRKTMVEKKAYAGSHLCRSLL
jgi:hypothetical protein